MRNKKEGQQKQEEGKEKDPSLPPILTSCDRINRERLLSRRNSCVTSGPKAVPAPLRDACRPCYCVVVMKGYVTVVVYIY